MATLNGNLLLDSDGLKWIQLEAPSVKATTDPWFSIIRPSLSLDTVTRIEVETQSLTLLSPPNTDTPTIVRLEARGQESHEGS